MNEKVRRIVGRYSKNYPNVELDELPKFLGKFQREIIKALGKQEFKELSYGAQNVLGNSWILIDTLKNNVLPEKWIEAVCR